MKLNPFCSSKHHLRKVLLALTCGALPLLTACGSDKIVGIYEIHPNRVGRPIGFIKLKDTNAGLLIESNLKNSTPGKHAFHIHEGNTCAAGIKDGIAIAGFGAEGHWDPDENDSHQGPDGEGHRGDLANLIVSNYKTATTPQTASRIKLSEIINKSLVIHSGKDDYTDNPSSGGSGEQIACGVIK